MPLNWLKRSHPPAKVVVAPIVKGSPAGEVMLECLRRDVALTLDAEGAVEMQGRQADLVALKPFVQQHVDVITAALASFKVAVPPPTLAELH